jgi:large subunit ribosomal protein L3
MFTWCEPITREVNMKKGILGKKIGMTQIFDDNGKVLPVTVVKAGPCHVLQIKSQEKDGYKSICVGFEDIRESLVNKPVSGLYKKADVKVKRYIRELRLDDADKFEVGQELKLDEVFKAGETIDVSGTSKGKGFQGVIKRHGQSRGRMTHGSHFHRSPGAMSGCSDPSRVFKGKKLPGHMGHEKITVQNLNIVRIDKENNLMLIKGAVPGPKGGLLVISDAAKYVEKKK